MQILSDTFILNLIQKFLTVCIKTREGYFSVLAHVYEPIKLLYLYTFL